MTTADGLVVYAVMGADQRPRSWRIQLGDIDQRLDAGNAFSYPRAIGQVQVNRSGGSGWLVKVFDLAGHGTNWQQLRLFVLDGERLKPVTLDGDPLAIRVGGISRMGEGATCRAGHLVLLRTVAENIKNTRWSYSMTPYRIDGSTAHRGRRRHGRLDLRGYNDPKLDPFYEVNCNGFSYP